MAQVKIYAKTSMIANRKGWAAKTLNLELKTATVANLSQVAEKNDERLEKLRAKVTALKETFEGLKLRSCQQFEHNALIEEED